MLTSVMLRWDGSVCRLSVKRVQAYMMRKRHQLADLPNVLLLSVQRNSRKLGPWNYSLTCRPVLTQVLVPKTTRETVKNLRHLTSRPLPQTQTLWLSCLTDRSDRHKSPADGQSKQAQLNTQQKKNRTNNFLYLARQHLRLSGHICIRLLNHRNTKTVSL